MARRRNESGDFDPDPLAPDPGEPRPRTIEGIVGESSRPNHVRLFLDLTFQQWYDIPTEAVLRRERVPAERSPLGVDSSILFVRPGTFLSVELSETRSVEQEFLEGTFTQPESFTPYPAGAAAFAPQVGGIAPTDMGATCFNTRCRNCSLKIGCWESRGLCSMLCPPPGSRRWPCLTQLPGWPCNEPRPRTTPPDPGCGNIPHTQPPRCPTGIECVE